MGSGGRRAAERRVGDEEMEEVDSLDECKSYVLHFKRKSNPVVKKSSKTKKQQERARKYFMFKMNQLRER